MRTLAPLPLLCALWGCSESTPCDGVPGTCLTVQLLSSGNHGERLDAVRFAVEGDGALRYEHSWTAPPGGQLLPLLAPLPLPDEAERTIKIAAFGLWNNRTLVSGTRVVSNLRRGDRRAIAITLAGASGPGRCDDGVQNNGETGIDCGGSCAPCGPRCDDGIRNGSETDVDCGGDCAPCLGGQACQRPADCLSGRCEGASCVRALGLASLSPDGGPTNGGVEVTLRGELLREDMEVRFGAARATLLQVAADGRSATVTLPPGPAGPVDVTVRQGADSAVRPGAFAYHFGTLSFSAAPPFGPGNKPYFVLSGHFNRSVDMIPDIAVINEFDCDVALFLGRGDGTFMKSGSYTVGREAGTYPLMAAPGDFNGDGVTDFATADNRQPTASVVLCKGDGTCLPSVQYDLPPGSDRAWPPAAATADFNGDGLDDVTVIDGSNGGRVFLLLASGDRSGRMMAPQLVLGGAFGVPESDATIAAARLDSDTYPDIVVANSKRRTVKVLLGNGDGTFRAGGEFPVGGIATFVLTVVDWNRDGLPDILSANRGSEDVSFLAGRGDGTFAAPRTMAACLGPYHIRAGDLDGDGRLDLAVPCYREERMGSSVLMLMFGDGRGGVARTLALTVPATAYGVTINDWNGDGRLDLATVSVAPSNALTIITNRSQ